MPDQQHERLVRDTEEAVKRSYQSLAHLIRGHDRPALHSIRPNDFITHGRLRNFVTTFALPLELEPPSSSSSSSSVSSKPVVVIALPNGPLMAALTIAVATYYTAVPINPAAGPDEFQADIIQVGARCVLTTAHELERLHLGDYKTLQDTLSIFIVEADDGTIVLRRPDSRPLTPITSPQPTPNRPGDVAIIHVKGGAWGARELIPSTLHQVVSQAVRAINDWHLTPDDTCLGMLGVHNLYVSLVPPFSVSFVSPLPFSPCPCLFSPLFPWSLLLFPRSLTWS